jgi:hypothetical protein
MAVVLSHTCACCADGAPTAAHGTHAAGLHRQPRELRDGHGAVPAGLYIGALRRQLQHRAGAPAFLVFLRVWGLGVSFSFLFWPPLRFAHSPHSGTMWLALCRPVSTYGCGGPALVSCQRERRLWQRRRPAGRCGSPLTLHVYTPCCRRQAATPATAPPRPTWTPLPRDTPSLPTTPTPPPPPPPHP